MPAAMPSARALRLRTRFSRRLARAMTTNAGRARMLVTLVPTSNATARAIRKRLRRVVLKKKNAEQATKDATTMSLRPVLLCSATTGRVRKSKAPNNADRMSNPMRRPIPYNAALVAIAATSCTNGANRPVPDVTIVKAIAISPFGANPLSR